MIGLPEFAFVRALSLIAAVLLLPGCIVYPYRYTPYAYQYAYAYPHGAYPPYQPYYPQQPYQPAYRMPDDFHSVPDTEYSPDPAPGVESHPLDPVPTPVPETDNRPSLDLGLTHEDVIGENEAPVTGHHRTRRPHSEHHREWHPSPWKFQ